MADITPILVGDLRMTDRLARFSDLSSLAEKCEAPLAGQTLDVSNISDKNLADALINMISALGGKTVTNGEPLYKFAVWSDIHLYPGNDQDLGDGRGRVDFKTAISAAQLHGVKLAAVCGDIGMNRSTLLSTTEFYQEAVSSIPHDFPISCCTGNHDQYLTDDEWRNMTSCDMSSYWGENEGDIFFFLSLKSRYTAGTTTEAGNALQDNPYLTSDIELLSSVLSSNPGRRVFIFTHFPFNACRTVLQYPGLGREYYGGQTVLYTSGSDDNTAIYEYGFSLTSDTKTNAQNDTLLSMIKSYDGMVVVFNGHSHYEFEIDKWMDGINYMEIAPNKHIFHTPSLNYPRNRDGKTIAYGNEINQPSQGYIVSVYSDRAIVNGYEFNLNLTNNNPLGELRRSYTVR